MAKSILAPVDGSKYMERNVSYASEVAKSMGSKLTLIHVVTLPVLIQPDPYIVQPEPLDVTPFEQAGMKILEKAKEIAKRTGIDPQTKLETAMGNPAQKILAVAETGEYDLILIGAKGHSLLRNLMVGSVCDTVVHNAPCPVLVIR